MPPSEEFKRLYRHGTLVIWPPNEVRGEVGALRQRYDPSSQAICDAHITLTLPFQSEPAARDLERIESVVASVTRLGLEYGPVASFLPYPCVYLAIEPQGPLRALQRALYGVGLFNRSFPHSDPDQFIFHMSITDGYPDEKQTAQIVEALSGSEPAGSFICESAAWIQPDEHFHFRTVRTFNLGNASTP